MKYALIYTTALALLAAVPVDAVALGQAGQGQAAPARGLPGGPTAGVTPQPPIGYPQALILIRSSLTALQQADETGDYDVLYALASGGFKKTNPAASLRQTFAPLKGYNLNSVLVLEPQFTQVPALTENGMMTMSGFFVSGGYRINFH